MIVNKFIQTPIVFLIIVSACFGEFSIEEDSEERLIINFAQNPNSLSISDIRENIYNKISMSDPNTYKSENSIILQKKDRKFLSHRLKNIINHNTKINLFDIDSLELTSEDLIKLSQSNIYSVSETMVMRDVVIFNLSVNPIKWNQETNMIEIVQNVDIIFEYGAELEELDVTQQKSKTFEDIFSGIIFNYNLDSAREIDYQSPAILYICGGNIESNYSFLNLIEWRRKQGFTVYTASLDETGSSSSSIKNYIYYAYDNFDPKPEYVALVGDANGSYSVPTFYECWNHDVWGDACEGDQPYSQLVGNDLFPEIIVGRISIRSTSDMSVISSKIINYEKASALNEIEDYYTRAALVADPSSSGQSTIFTNQYIEQLLSQFGFEDINTNFGNGGYDNWMEDQLEDGVLYLNYRGYNGASGFDAYDINDANNGPMLPFATFLTCNTGNFAEDNASLSEYFLRAGTLSNPKGAIASVGTATGNTHTLFNNIVNMGIYSGLFNKNLQTAGQAIVNGKLELLNTYPSNPYNWISAFSQWNNLMGDPATHLWTAKPQIMILNYPSQIYYGTKHLDIIVKDLNNIPIQDARVTLIKGDNEIFETKLTDQNGFVRITFDYETDGPISLNVTKQNFKPEEETINIISNSVSIYCDNPNNIFYEDGNTSPEPGDSIFFSVPLKNYGTSSAFGVTALLETSNPNVTIINANSSYGIIEPDQEINGTNFGILLSTSTQDKEDCELLLTISDNSSLQWQSPINIDVWGTKVNIDNVLIPNNIIEQGSLTEISLELFNLGRIATSNNLYGILESTEPLVQILSSETSWESIDPEDYQVSNNPFTIFPSSELFGGTIIQMNLILNGEGGFQLDLPFTITIGEISENDPTGPDSYGYYIYDSEDIYELSPQYDWIEISDVGDNLNLDDPGNGRGYCSEEDDMVCNTDEDCDPPGWGDYGFCEFTEATKTVNLPFDFRFYGESYSLISISSNGWIAFGETDMSSFRNYGVPGPGGPSPMVAVFWDDHRTTGGGEVYTYFSQEINAFIVQWDDMDTYFNGSDNTFQAILYSSTVPPNNDSEIKLQYKEFNNSSSGSFSGYTPIHGGYCTVGIEDETGNRGLQYTFNNDYPISSHFLEDYSALFITTMSPQTIPIPNLNYEPASISINILSEEYFEQEITIENSGDSGSNLNYAITKNYPQSESPFETAGGGPDEYGYFWTDSRLDTNSQFNWVNISDGDLVEFEHNDQASGPYDIGFDFPFYGVNYNQCIINPNGWIGFTSDNDGWSNQEIPQIDAPRAAIFAFWDDLNPINNSNDSGLGEVYFKTDNNTFTIWYNDVIHYPGNYNGVYNFQIVLHDGGDILVNYQSMDGDIESGTIGLQDFTGTRGLQVAFNQFYVENELTLYLKYDFYDWLDIELEPQNLIGILSAEENFGFMTSVASDSLDSGNYNMVLKILSNISSASIPVDMNISDGQEIISQDILINSGWNIVGLPLYVENNNYEVVFPQANENTLFYYDGMYMVDSTLTPGDGYWLRFDNEETAIVSGIAVNEIVLELNVGWNLISGPINNFNINNVIDIDNIIVPNTLFGFNQTYYNTDILIPGKGYWVRSNQDGVITFTDMELSRIIKKDSNLIECINTLNINGMNLYFGISISEEKMLSYSLPPKPPEGAFDVRFKDGWRIVSDYGEIEVKSIGETFPIRYDIKIDKEPNQEWILTSQSGKDYTLNGSGEIIVPSEEKFTLQLKEILPNIFALYQNFPNPFNPITTLRYDLPSDALVTLTVFDMLGKEVTQLVNTTQEAGFKSVQWDATDSIGRPVSAGVYLYQILAGEFVQTKKMVLLK